MRQRLRAIPFDDLTFPKSERSGESDDLPKWSPPSNIDQILSIKKVLSDLESFWIPGFSNEEMERNELIVLSLFLPALGSGDVTTFIEWALRRNKPEDILCSEDEEKSTTYLNKLVAHLRSTSTYNKAEKKGLDLLKEYLVDRFIEVEKKVLGASGKFESHVRCAAFVEVAYNEKYFLFTKTRRKTLNHFAIARYRIDIWNALKSSKKPFRDNHKVNVVSGLKPLGNCFK